MDLSTKHFFEWDKELKDELFFTLKNRFYYFFNLDSKYVEDIILSGSRIYKIEGLDKYFFNEESDLDVKLLIDNTIFNKYFLPINAIIMSNLYIDILKEQYKNKFIPKMPGFYFYGIRVSIFLGPYLGKYDNKFVHWTLPYYSVKEGKYYSESETELMDYLINIKQKIDINKFCRLCKKEISSKNILSFKCISEEAKNIDVDKFSINFSINICNNCYNKLLKNGYTTLIDNLQKIIKEVE